MRPCVPVSCARQQQHALTSAPCADAHASPNVPGSKECIQIFARTYVATAGHERTHNHICVYFVRVCPPGALYTHAPALTRTHMCEETATHARSTRILPHTQTRARTGMKRQRHTTLTHTHTWFTHIARTAVCARARSAAGGRRSFMLLGRGTLRQRRCCSRTAPTQTRGTSTGAAAHSSPF